MSKSLMIQGTCSGAGKSLFVAGFCRFFADMGIKVAPFKSQNMALNSYITEDGSEIGRAQALQAEAARIKPHADMNPVLLKARGEKGSQVIVGGKVHSNMTAKEYYAFKDEAWEHVTSSYERLRSIYDLIVIEGAGSPAEINLTEKEIVNMKVARHADAPVLLVGDIDRGGVFASFCGTLGLLGDDAEYIKGFLINKFRGDKDILKPGLDMLREKTGTPVLGVVPYAGDIGLDEEDGLSLPLYGSVTRNNGHINVVVVKLNYISNFTDFAPFKYEPDVNLIFSSDGGDIETADLLIVPGSKNTVKDLLFLRRSGLEESIRRAAGRGVPVVGICGGYQMLGKRIADPEKIESDVVEVRGLGLLDTETVIKNTKRTSQAEARTELFGFRGKLKGYEIHMGATTGDVGLFTLDGRSRCEEVRDGSLKGNVWGTYLHGIFDNDGFRTRMLNVPREKKGLTAPRVPVEYEKIKDGNIDVWTAFLTEHIDMESIKELI